MNIDYISIFHRQSYVLEVKSFVETFYQKNKLNDQKLCLYVYGHNGIGKTMFIKDTLEKLGYNCIRFGTSGARNKNMFNSITKDNISCVSIESYFKIKKNHRRNVILLDDIHTLQHTDRGSITTLFNLIKRKRSNKGETLISIPIICIDLVHTDKKSSDFKKHSKTLFLQPPTKDEIYVYIKRKIPHVDNITHSKLIQLYSGNIHHINNYIQLYKDNMFDFVNFHDDIENYNIINVKNRTKSLFEKELSIDTYTRNIHDHEKTSISLLFHENIIDLIQMFTISKQEKHFIYQKILEIICFADYIDRVTFQKQVWILNDIVFMLKIVLLTNTYHKERILYNQQIRIQHVFKNIDDIRFTKVLTKYSTEYNNLLFITNLCHTFMMEKKDMLLYFNYIQKHKIDYSDIMIRYEMSQLDMNRIFRFVNNLYNSNLE